MSEETRDFLFDLYLAPAVKLMETCLENTHKNLDLFCQIFYGRHYTDMAKDAVFTGIILPSWIKTF